MTTGRDYSRLPEQVSLESTTTSQDERPVQAPEGDRNNDQWNALNDGG